MRRYHPLNSQESRILIEKGTEAPGSGAYLHAYHEGVYLCKRCDSPLYMISDQFESGCGWPSFDDELPGAIVHLPDADGRRVEILCQRCRAHLGHVFKNEGFTEKNSRHCVNSIALRRVLAKDDEGFSKASFAAGCFWGVQSFFQSLTGVISTQVGYMGGSVVDPTYEEVCSGLTGHAEVVEVIFDPRQVSYEQLVKYFFEIHDPTQKGRQGPDIGSQYRSCIFYLTRDQETTARSVLKKLEKTLTNIATELEASSYFYAAEDFHQDYNNKNREKTLKGCVSGIKPITDL